MLRGGPAVLGVFLLVSTSLAVPCPRSIITRVETLMTENLLQNCSDSTLYTPSSLDFKRCPGTTLACFAAELKVLTDELRISGCKDFSKSVQRLETLSKRYKGETDCLQCEFLEEKSIDRFLSSLLSTLQQICSESAS
ncbi:interleukin 15, like isoform X2 [Oryzias melastigma]|uniref:interleukin 15, like isoform X2 n=1 Tax=Oryzias melastigma TaxID=30732 RepID=UPI000CF82566|nr:interleukin 15, like isoform X2 [Oryzias melastigma]